VIIPSSERVAMQPDRSETSTIDAQPPPLADPARVRGTAWARRGRRVAISSGLIATGLLLAVGWSELHPRALAEAEAAYRRNNLESALRIAQGHLERRPFSRHAMLLVARCLSRLGRVDQADRYFKKVGTLDVEDQHVRAYALVLANRREPAIRAFREILTQRPDDVLASSRLAAVLISESRWDDALKTSEHLIKLPAGAVIGHTLAGVVHHNTRDSELAVFDFDRVLELDPALKQMPLKPRSMFWIEYCHNLLVVGRCQEARQHLHRALKEADDPNVADLLAQSYYLEGALDHAEQCWRLALQWDARRFGTWLRIGTLQLQQGRSAEAVESLSRSVALEPKAVGPLYALGLAYRRLGRREESDRLMQQVKRLRDGTSARVSGDEYGSLLGFGATER
jgi:tetratricopeptide (TPR) repeat protein